MPCAWRCAPGRRSCRWRWSGRTEWSAGTGSCRTLLFNVVRRPKVDTGSARRSTFARLMNIGPTTEPTADEVRLAADLVMGRLVAVVADYAANVPQILTESPAPPTNRRVRAR